MIPPSLFLACFVTLAANPALVHSIPLPPPTRAAAASHPQQHFAAPAPTSTLRIVDEDASHDTIPASWVHSNNVITPDTLFADSILPGGVEASLNAVLASMQVAEIEHVRRGLKHKGQGKRMKRSVTKKEKRKADKKKRNVRKEKRFSPRRAEQQQAASSDHHIGAFRIHHFDSPSHRTNDCFFVFRPANDPHSLFFRPADQRRDAASFHFIFLFLFLFLLLNRLRIFIQLNTSVEYDRLLPSGDRDDVIRLLPRRKPLWRRNL
ncbi:hypothetical protein JCM1841_003752, partial [Sporobolomyces salmonicolor]